LDPETRNELVACEITLKTLAGYAAELAGHHLVGPPDLGPSGGAECLSALSNIPHNHHHHQAGLVQKVILNFEELVRELLNAPLDDKSASMKNK
jgi:hypothetical protein